MVVAVSSLMDSTAPRTIAASASKQPTLATPTGTPVRKRRAAAERTLLRMHVEQRVKDGTLEQKAAVQALRDKHKGRGR